MKKLLVLSVIGLGATLAWALPARADTPCVGPVGAIVIRDNVVVPPGAACTMVGTEVRGNVRVEQGARLETHGARIFGNVGGKSAREIEILDGTIVRGNVDAKGTQPDLTVGPVGAGNSGTVGVRNSSRVFGNVKVQDGFAPAGAFGVQNAEILGNAEFKNNTGGNSGVLSSLIRGNLLIQENDSSDVGIVNNSIGNNLEFIKNTGPAQISNNVIRGNLICKENNPPPTVGPNAVRGKIECES